MPKKLLGGKSARIVVTMGMPSLFYRLYYRSHSVRSLARNILGFVGVKPVRVSLIGNVEGDAKARTRRINELLEQSRAVVSEADASIRRVRQPQVWQAGHSRRSRGVDLADSAASQSSTSWPGSNPRCAERKYADSAIIASRLQRLDVCRRSCGSRSNGWAVEMGRCVLLPYDSVGKRSWDP